MLSSRNSPLMVLVLRLSKRAMAASLLQAGKGDAVFGLELDIGSGKRRHGVTLQGRVLHFRFESAVHRSNSQGGICSSDERRSIQIRVIGFESVPP